MPQDWSPKLCSDGPPEGGRVSVDDGQRVVMRIPAFWVAIFVYVAGDGWTFKAAPGWVVREGARRGDYEVVRQQQ